MVVFRDLPHPGAGRHVLLRRLLRRGDRARRVAAQHHGAQRHDDHQVAGPITFVDPARLPLRQHLHDVCAGTVRAEARWP